MNAKDLRRSAAILRREARAIKESHACGREQWASRTMADAMARDRADHDEMLDLARKLTAHAKALGAGARGME